MINLDALDTVIQNEKALKEIIRRLKENRNYIFLTDALDNSAIVIDDKVYNLILTYYQDKLLAMQIKTNTKCL